MKKVLKDVSEPNEKCMRAHEGTKSRGLRAKNSAPLLRTHRKLHCKHCLHMTLADGTERCMHAVAQALAGAAITSSFRSHTCSKELARRAQAASGEWVTCRNLPDPTVNCCFFRSIESLEQAVYC